MEAVLGIFWGICGTVCGMHSADDSKFGIGETGSPAAGCASRLCKREGKGKVTLQQPFRIKAFS